MLGGHLGSFNYITLTQYNDFDTVEEFLQNEHILIPLHASTIQNPLSVLNFSYDVDGLCVELQSVSYQ